MTVTCRDGIDRCPVTDDDTHEDVLAEVVGESLPSTNIPAEIITQNSDGGFILMRRDSLVEDYWKKRSEVRDKIDSKSAVDRIDAVAKEVLSETDSLKGTELLALERDDLGGASIVSSKRTNALEQLAKVIHRSVELRKMIGVDLDHPHIQVLFRYFMKKAVEALDSLEIDDELRGMFLLTMQDKVKEWRRDVQYEIDKTSQGAM